ncbi:MAG: hypothetical protein KC708_10570, partial [Anaerolineae bacterium]|nr:hypothetical protein [Anaerolineae bacterium]
TPTPTSMLTPTPTSMLTPTPTSMLTPTPTSMLTPTPTSMLTPPSGYADEGEYQQGEEFQNTEKSLAQILAPYIAVCVLIVISYSFGKLSRPSFAKIKEAHFSSIDEVQTSVPSNTIYNILSQTLDKLKGGSDGSKHHGNSIFSKISHLLLSQVEVFIVQRWDIDINKLENADLLRKTRNAFEEEKRSVRIKAYLIIIALLSFLWFLNDGSFEALIAAIVSWAAVFGFKS